MDCYVVYNVKERVAVRTFCVHCMFMFSSPSSLTFLCELIVSLLCHNKSCTSSKNQAYLYVIFTHAAVSYRVVKESFMFK